MIYYVSDWHIPAHTPTPFWLSQCYYVILDIDNNTTLLKFNWHLFQDLQTNDILVFFCHYILIDYKIDINT
jgi:hypothetical protein